MQPPMLATRSGATTVRRVLSARPDTADFRDRLFEPTLVEVPTRMTLADYQAQGLPILDQGQEGACTGFALAAVANFLLARRRVVPDRDAVSPRMLYAMARRYDEWPGEDYEWSSARGAMKGWHKHGVCSEARWPTRAAAGAAATLDAARSQDALRRPLGAYLRVNHLDLVAMHSALAEAGILYATAGVHAGWDAVGPDGRIPWRAASEGGHAFAIVGYDEHGFWLQNSWGPAWGCQGFAHLGYDDWLANATDVWVARLGAPVVLRGDGAAAAAHAAVAGQSAGYAYAQLRAHAISLGNDGRLKARGDYACSAHDVHELFEHDLPRTTREWPVRHVLLYAHGGLVDERSAMQRLADWRATLLAQHIYPIGFVWRSDGWSTLAHLLQDAWRKRQPVAGAGGARDFLLERVDDTLELLVRTGPGKLAWDEMKENALAASAPGGGARLALEHLARATPRLGLRLHVAAHSAGAVFQAPIVRQLTAPCEPHHDGAPAGASGFGLALDTCTLWAPACTTALFRADYLPALRAGRLGRLALYALNDHAERSDHVARLYGKSLLYLVSRALEDSAWGAGTPLLGMQRWLAADAELAALFSEGLAELVLAPNSAPDGAPGASRCAAHDAFDDDATTLRGLVRRILDSASGGPRGSDAAAAVPVQFHARAGSLRQRRRDLQDQ